MYYQVIAQCTQSLKNLDTCLDKADRYPATKKFDVGVLMSGRLAPDMQPFTYQVQSACDYVKGGAAWRHPGTRITSKRSMNCAPGFGRLLLSRRA
jgi:hypothetical protein